MTDFTKYFSKRKVRPLNFTLQQNVNYLHEVVFLSSYLHDATFLSSEFVVNKGVLTLPIKRDCWEYWTRLHQHADGLLWCNSLLTITGIHSVQWSRSRLPKTVEISSVFVGEDHYFKGKAHLVLYSFGQKLKLALRGHSDSFKISLIDLDKPK